MSLQHFEDIWQRSQVWEAAVLPEVLNVFLVVGFNVEEQYIPWVLFWLKLEKEFGRVMLCHLSVTAESTLKYQRKFFPRELPVR